MVSSITGTRERRRRHAAPTADFEAQASAEWQPPTRWSSLVFRAKQTLLRLERGAQNRFVGLPRLGLGEHARFPAILGESVTPLWSNANPREQAMERGKVQNLRAAVRHVDRLALMPDQVFSFWRQIGRATRRRGFVPGRMLQQGCMLPAVGGGLCQLSNALYDVALQAGCEIVERHPHSRRVPGSAAAIGRDATVAWNYVDLRFRARQPLLLEARLDRDALVLRLRGIAAARDDAEIIPLAPAPERAARSCASCNETSCFRHEAPAIASSGRRAFLLDENWPEIRRYLVETRRPDDLLGIPLAGDRWRIDRYRWPTRGFARVGTATVATLRRMIRARHLPAQGPTRRLAELEGASEIAARLGRLLTADVTEVVIAQSLLPRLWREGALGGRAFTVVMTRLPMALLQARLDAAAACHPERATLGDFRAPAAVVEAETEALAAAERIVTPHREIAALFPGRATLVDWVLPEVIAVSPGRQPRHRIAFAGPTVARKGAHELRDALRGLDLELLLLGNELEGPEFWRGIRTTRPDPRALPFAWVTEVAAIVQPALVEERPRHLLAARAAGLPIIATAACGLAEAPNLVVVPALDAPALHAAVVQALQRRA